MSFKLFDQSAEQCYNACRRMTRGAILATHAGFIVRNCEQHMESLVSLPGLTVSPNSRGVVRFEISADINITAFAATPKRTMNVLCISMLGDCQTALGESAISSPRHNMMVWVTRKRVL